MVTLSPISSALISAWHPRSPRYIVSMSPHFPREHKSYRERKQMWLSNSIYYHQLTALYLRQPGVGVVLLQMVVNNAERAKVGYTAGNRFEGYL